MSATYVTASGRRVRVLGNNLLIKPDPPPKETRGGILIANPNLALPHSTGQVVAIGYLTGPKAALHTSIPGVHVGDHVLYLRVLAHTDVNPQIGRVVEDGLIRIRPSDVLLVLDSEDRNRVE